MAPQWPDEVDVFTVPHTRMKKLVQDYSNLVSTTDFSNEYHMTNLLQNLINVFSEFKAHEQIENMLIMKRLRRKLRAASVICDAVCNCHSDNRLTEMLDLVVAGYSMTQKSTKERQAYGRKLQLALEDFTQNFIPHMEEEEEVFQPMLIKYFSYEELKELKANVIREHSISKRQEGYCHEKCVEELYHKDSTEIPSTCHFDKLPNEIFNKIFKYLGPQDLARASQVCHQWNEMALDPSLWTGIYPVHWARGNWTFHPESLGGVDGQGDETTSDQFKFNYELDCDYPCTLDEDADVDEFENEDKDDEKRNEVLKEARMLTGIVKSLLPRVGQGINKIDLAYSKGISSSLMHKILKLCKSVEVLDATHTQIGDSAFVDTNLLQSKLRHLDLTGCQNITDQSLVSLTGRGYKDCKLSDFEVSDLSSRDPDVEDADLEIENVPPSCSEKLSKCCGQSITALLDKPPSVVCSEEIAKNCDAYSQEIAKNCDACSPTKLVTSMKGKVSRYCPQSHETVCSTVDKAIQDFEIENKSWCSLKQNLDWITPCQNVQLDGNSRMRDNQMLEKCLDSSHSSGCVKTKEREPCNCCDSSTRPPLLCEKRDSDFSKTTDISCLGQPVTSDCCFADCELLSNDTSSLLPFYDKDLMVDEFRCDCADLCLSNDSGSDFSSCCHEEHSSIHENDEVSAIHDQVSSEEEAKTERGREVDKVPQFVPPLEFLSLNGCYQISDHGLIALADGLGTPFLTYLDLSGCMAVSGHGISRVVSTCKNLSHSNLFYCDNTPNDPYPDTACGCKNLESRTRFCCRMNDNLI